MKNIGERIGEVVKELFGVELPVLLTPVPEGREGDLATNVAFRVARGCKRNARDVAGEIVEALGMNDSGVTVQVAGAGFINVTIGGRVLFDALERGWSESYGHNNDGEGKLAVVEFPSPNMAKPYSVGHLRPGNQGWAVKKLLEATGWRVVTDNHLGDSGTPFGVWATGFVLMTQVLESSADLVELGAEDRAFFEEEAGKYAENGVDVYMLGRIYIQMKAMMKDGDEAQRVRLEELAQEWLLKLENGDEEAEKLSEKFNEISLKHIHEVMGRLGIETDYELGERFFVERGKELVEKYLAEGIFEKNEDGSVICGLPGFDVPLLVLKANGAALYATTDLATIVYRAEEWAPDKVVYCVGAEQKFYFEQLFAMAKKIGMDMELVHLWFGTIDQIADGRREKMSSRKGVVLMEDLLDRAEAAAWELTAGREVSEEDVRRIAVGAVKFSDFLADKKTGILFDWKKIFALSGFSGPSCQYAAVRAGRILELNKEFVRVDYEGYDFAAEKKILRVLLEFPGVVKMAAERLEAHRVANYVFRLAQEFNRYYEEVPVRDADDLARSARLDVVGKVRQVMVEGLGLLGVEVPGKM